MLPFTQREYCKLKTQVLMRSTEIPYDALRPEELNINAWSAIVDAWQNGLSDREAAFRASKNGGKRYTEADIKGLVAKYPELAELREQMQSDILAKAKLNIYEKIKEGDIATSKWYLERKAAEEFSTKAAVKFEGDVIELSIEDKEKKAKEFLEQFGE